MSFAGTFIETVHVIHIGCADHVHLLHDLHRTLKLAFLLQLRRLDERIIKSNRTRKRHDAVNHVAGVFQLLGQNTLHRINDFRHELFSNLSALLRLLNHVDDELFRRGAFVRAEIAGHNADQVSICLVGELLRENQIAGSDQKLSVSAVVRSQAIFKPSVKFFR